MQSVELEQQSIESEVMEFLQLPAPQPKRIYDWRLRRYITVAVQDTGRCAPVRPADTEAAMKPEPKQASARQLVDQYIEENGPSSNREICEAHGLNTHVVGLHLSKNFSIVVPEQPPLWDVTEAGRSATFSNESIAALCVQYLIVHGPSSAADIAAGIKRKRNSVRSALYHFYFEEVRPKQPTKWGIAK